MSKLSSRVKNKTLKINYPGIQKEMKKPIKIISLILAIILLIVIIVIVILKIIWDNINFKLNFRGVDLSQFNLQTLTNLLNGGEITAKLKLGVDIKNDNNLTISFSNLKVWLSYGGVLVAETTDKIFNANLQLLPNSNKIKNVDTGEVFDDIHELTDDVTIHVNSALINLVRAKISGSTPQIDYKVSVKMHPSYFPSFSYSTSDYFVWDASTSDTGTANVTEKKN